MVAGTGWVFMLKLRSFYQHRCHRGSRGNKRCSRLYTSFSYMSFSSTKCYNSGFTMRSLLDFDPNIKSSGSFYVGSYVLQLVVHLSLQMAAHISDFAAAPVGCMKACHIAGLRSSLILIFARLVCISTIGIFEFVTSTPMTLLVASVAFHVHMSVPDVSQFINLLLAVPAEGNEKALACIVSEWAEQQVEIQGTSQIKVNTTAFSFTALHQTHSTELLWETSRRLMVSRRRKKAEENRRLWKKFARFSVEELELMRSKHEYEDNSSEEADLGKDFDKVKMILQEHGKVLDSFFQSTAAAEKFQTDAGKAWAAKINLRRT